MSAICPSRNVVRNNRILNLSYTLQLKFFLCEVRLFSVRYRSKRKWVFFCTEHDDIFDTFVCVCECVFVITSSIMAVVYSKFLAVKKLSEYLFV